MHEDYEDLFGLRRYRDLLTLPDPTWLIDGIIPTQGFVGLYGASGSGKSFIALDWALSVATGRPWMGHATNQAPSIYIAAEGGSGIKRRVRAWAQYYNDNELPGAYFLLEPLYVREEGVVETFLANLEDERCDINPGMIVIDTLARSFGGGDENAATDMGHFIDRVNAIARDRHITMAVVHHTNVTGNRERGSGAFRGAADTMFLCEATKHESTGRILLLTLSNNKQKDDQEAPDIYMRPMDDVTASIVLELTDAPTTASSSATIAFMRKADMVAVLGAMEHAPTWREWQLACGGIPKASFFRRIRQLQTAGDIFKQDGRYYVQMAGADIAEMDDE